MPINIDNSTACIEGRRRLNEIVFGEHSEQALVQSKAVGVLTINSLLGWGFGWEEGRNGFLHLF